MSVYLNPALGGAVGSNTRQVLDGVEYRVLLAWLAEEPGVPFQVPPDPPPLTFGPSGVWTLALAQLDGTLLISGQLVRDGVNLLAGFRGDLRFPGRGLGQLLSWDIGGLGRNPGRDDLDPGSAIRLAYVPAAES